jgi:hypothetical protein
LSKLLQYCYSEDSDPVPEQLQKLVTKYIACNVTQLWRSDKFQELLRTSGDLSVSLVESLLRRLE